MKSWRRRMIALARGSKALILGRPRLMVFFLLAILIAGHWLYHYRPRFRPAAPSGPEASLLDLPWAEVAVWIPYPHQNLTSLERRAGLVPESGGDVLTLAEVETPRLPSFGGMLSPPASSLALASGERGELVVAARIYPTFAAFARLAGFLAKNPWLGGGEVTWQGRRIEVAWRDGLWLAGSPSLPELRPARPEQEAAILVADARRPAAPLPAGRYRLRLEGEDLVIRSASAENLVAEDGEALDGEMLSRAEALLLIIAEGPNARAEGQAMALFSQPSEAITELPRAAVLHRGARQFELPGESLLEIAGHEFERAELAGYSLLATDTVALEGAALLAEPLAARLDGVSRDLDLWLRLEPAAHELSRLCRGLEQAPFISKRQLRSWQSAERLLRGLSSRHQSLRIEVRHGLGPDGQSTSGAGAGPALLLRIERR